MLTPAAILERQGVERLYRVIRGADPAAGAEVSVTVPGGAIWIVQSLVVALVNDATAISRTVHLTMDDGTTVFCRIGQADNQIAGQTNTYSWVRDFGGRRGLVVGQTIQNGFPQLPLLSGMRIRTATVNLQAGDNFGAPVLYVQEVQERGLAAEIAYEVHNLIREDVQLSAIEREGFT